MLNFFKDVFNHFFNSNTFQKGAALAYYAVFSILPMIIIITSVLGLIWGKQVVSGEIYEQLKGILGNEASLQIQELIKKHNTNYNTVLTTIIGFATLILSASGMFSQVHNSFNSIWNIKAKPKSSILKYLSKHLTAFLILILLFFILLASSALNSFLLRYGNTLNTDYQLLYLYEHLISFVVISLAFSIMFNYLGDAKIHWKAAIFGGIFTAFLFVFGKIGISMYISHSKLSTTFGSASVLALLMLWVYYTAQIIFLGASFVKIISIRLGHTILPNSNAVAIKNVEVAVK